MEYQGLTLEGIDHIKESWKCTTKGTTRIVYFSNCGKYVVKRSRHTINCPPNRLEYILWNMYKDTEYQELLCPVIDLIEVPANQENYLIMPRCEENERSIPMDIIYKLEDIQIGDIATFNFGYLDKRLVCFDYGYTDDDELRGKSSLRTGRIMMPSGEIYRRHDDED